MAGNKKEITSPARVEQEVREPLVDVFEEDDYLLVEAELPGIGKRNVVIDFENYVLTISARRGERRFRGEVLLPRDISQERMQITCKYGILRIKWLK